MRPAVAAMAILIGTSVANAAPCTLAGLQWLKGAWRFEGGGEQNEMVWTGASENRLFGYAWNLHAARPGGDIQVSAIQIESKHVTLHLRHFTGDLGLAREDIDQPVTFAATTCSEGAVTFEGQGAARGQKLSYQRQGDKLTFASEAGGGKPGHVEIAFMNTME